MIMKKQMQTQKQKSSPKGIKALFSFGRYADNGIIEMDDTLEKRYICVIRISGIDIFGYSEADTNMVYGNFAKATIALKLPHKYVFTDSHPFLSANKEFLQYKLERTEHPFRRHLLAREIQRMELLEQNQQDRLAYLIVFGTYPDNLLKACREYISMMQIDTSVEICDKTEVMHVLHKYVNFGDNIYKTDFTQDLNTAILPDEIELHHDCIRVGDKYVTSLVVSEYPSFIPALAYANIFASFESVTVTLDVTMDSKSNVVANIKKSLKELNSRNGIRQDLSDEIDTGTELSDLTQMYTELTRGKEQILSTTLRFYASSESYTGLKTQIEKINNILEDNGISTFIGINEMRQEYSALLKSADTVGNPIPLQGTFKEQYPFYYQSHIDEFAPLYAFTETDGMVCLDTFVRNQHRKSYDKVLLGIKGSGKSLTLKADMQQYCICGNRLLVLDLEGEYTDLADVLGGKVLYLNRNSVINPLQLQDSDEDENNFAAELSRIMTFFAQYIPNLSETAFDELKSLLQLTFERKNITEATDISSLQAKDFPMISDLLAILRERLYENHAAEQDKINTNISRRRAEVLETLEISLKPIAEGIYASMFNGHTTLDIGDSDFVVFNTKQLAEMEARVFNAQLFNILSLIWGEICRNKAYNQQIYHPYDRRYVIAVIEEAHRYINSKNSQVTDFIEKLERRTRKYDAALWYASQSILDHTPSGTGEGNDQVKKIFDLVQYKMIMNQPENCIATLSEMFSQFTESELAEVPMLEAGEMLISLSSGRHKIRCKRFVDRDDMFYMGNSRDREDIIRKLLPEIYNDMTQDEMNRMVLDDPNGFVQEFTDQVIVVLYSDDYSVSIRIMIEKSVKALVQQILQTQRRAYENQPQ
ncbi:MAG: hypothetical protein QM689_01645 [Oscillospiraceae bacterium]